jgi:hypothetical protein
MQTDPHWIIHIIHDGPAPQDVKDIISLPQYRDERIIYEETPQVNGHWGHPNRGMMLKKLALNHRDYVLITNDDNYYVPKFVKYVLDECDRGAVGMVYCNTVHSYFDYNMLETEIKENHIDMGSFVVKLDVARRVGFNHIHLSADGIYAERCASYCKARRLRMLYIPRPLFVHN